MPTSNADPVDGSSSAMPEVGHAIGERYHLDREARRTDAGLVYDATDRVARRRVAIEVASSVQDPRARTKWARDAMMAQRLEGEHILRVLDVSTLPNGMPYVVREAGVLTLADELAARGALPLQEAVCWTLEACEAVAEAHALGIAHGDLRLENVHLVRGAEGMSVKVAWTSAAKAERAAKEDVARDIAALGALLRALVTGRLDDQEADGVPTLPTEIAHTVARALAQDPEGSFHNVGELARTLTPFAPPGNVSARSVASRLSRAGIVGSSIALHERSPLAHTLTVPPDRLSIIDEWFGHEAPTQTAPPPRSNRATAFALVSLALVGFVLGGSAILWQSGRLPHWTGAAPPADVGTTQLTSGPAPPAPAETTPDETPSAPVDQLPNVALPEPPPPSTATATAPPQSTPVTKLTTPKPPMDLPPLKANGDLRYVDPSETPQSADPTPIPTTTPMPAPVDSEPTPTDPPRPSTQPGPG